MLWNRYRTIAHKSKLSPCVIYTVFAWIFDFILWTNIIINARFPRISAKQYITSSGWCLVDISRLSINYFNWFLIVPCTRLFIRRKRKSEKIGMMNQHLWPISISTSSTWKIIVQLIGAVNDILSIMRHKMDTLILSVSLFIAITCKWSLLEFEVHKCILNEALACIPYD